MALFLVGPMLLLSGITSPFESMPRWVQAIMTLPLRYYIDITYGVMLKGAIGSVVEAGRCHAVVGRGAVRFRDVAVSTTIPMEPSKASDQRLHRGTRLSNVTR